MRIIIFSIISSFIINLLNCDKLRFVFEMFRHGARSPWNGLNASNVDVLGQKWNGPGELTAVGMREHFLLGYRNRMVYGNFLSSNYKVNEIYAISTDVNRTIMSANSQIQGIYQPGTGPSLTPVQQDNSLPPVNKTNFDVEKAALGTDALPEQIQVIPLHIFDPHTRVFNLHKEKICPGAGVYNNEGKTRPPVLEFYKKFNLTWGEKLFNALNITDENYFFDFDNTYKLCDTFKCAYTDGRDLSILSNAGIDLQQFDVDITEFLRIDINVVGFGDENHELGLMSMSPTMRRVIQWMDIRKENDANGIGYDGFKSPKLAMYSAHDTDMGAILAYMKRVFNTSLYYEPFASSIFFELYQSETNNTNYYVKAIYNDIDLIEKMDYEEFRDLVDTKSYTTSKVADFCEFESVSSFKVDFFFVSSIVLLLLCVLLGGYIIKLKKGQDKPAQVSDYQGV